MLKLLVEGSSPHTDLRSTGMLSLVQMLFFLDSHFQVADDIFSLSQDTVHGFPFMVVGIRMTLLVMHVVREVRLVSFLRHETAASACLWVLTALMMRMLARAFALLCCL